jgi:hypothetical protein
LAILPVPEGRRAERRVVNLAASLRDPGASVLDAEIVDLSTNGFRAETATAIPIGTQVWLKLPGLEPTSSHCVWSEGLVAGFEFASPLHVATLDLVIATARKPMIKRHFGKQPAAAGGY